MKSLAGTFFDKLEQLDLDIEDQELPLVSGFSRYLIDSRAFELIAKVVDNKNLDEDESIDEWLRWLTISARNADAFCELLEFVENRVPKEVFKSILDNNDYFLLAACQYYQIDTLRMLEKFGKYADEKFIEGLIAYNGGDDNEARPQKVFAEYLSSGDIESASAYIQLLRAHAGNEGVKRFLRNNKFIDDAMVFPESLEFILRLAIDTGGNDMAREMLYGWWPKADRRPGKELKSFANIIWKIADEIGDEHLKQDISDKFRVYLFKTSLESLKDGKSLKRLEDLFASVKVLSRLEIWSNLMEDDYYLKTVFRDMNEQQWIAFINETKEPLGDDLKFFFGRNDGENIGRLFANGYKAALREAEKVFEKREFKWLVERSFGTCISKSYENGADNLKEAISQIVSYIGKKRTVALFEKMAEGRTVYSLYTLSKDKEEGTRAVFLRALSLIGGEELAARMQKRFFGKDAISPANILKNKSGHIDDDPDYFQIASRDNLGIYSNARNRYFTAYYKPEIIEKYNADPLGYSTDSEYQSCQASWVDLTGHTAPHPLLVRFKPRNFNHEVFEFALETIRRLTDLKLSASKKQIEAAEEDIAERMFRNPGGLDCSIVDYAFKMAETFTSLEQADYHIYSLLIECPGVIDRQGAMGPRFRGPLLLPASNLPSGSWNHEHWAGVISEAGFDMMSYLPIAPAIEEYCTRRKKDLPKTVSEANWAYVMLLAEKCGVCLLDGVLEELLEVGEAGFVFESGLTFGTENEILGIDEKEEAFVHIRNLIQQGWKLVDDGAVRVQNVLGGKENVSPILKTPEDIEQYGRAIELPGLFGAWVNSSCAFHVHIGVRNNFSEEQGLAFVKQFCMNYMEIEKDLAFLDHRTKHNYADILLANLTDKSSVFKNILGAATVKDVGYAIRPDARDVDDEVTLLRQRAKVNVLSYYKHGTLEVRHHTGTVNPKENKAWLKFIDRMSLIAKEASVDGARVPNENDIVRMKKAVEQYKEDRKGVIDLDDADLPSYKRAILGFDGSTRKVNQSASFRKSAYPCAIER